MKLILRLVRNSNRRAKRMQAKRTESVLVRVDRLDSRLADIESHLKRPPLRQRQLAVFFAVMLFFLAVASAISYGLFEHRDRAFIFEFASYAFAALAAVFVGLGLFVGRDRIWFGVSATLVTSGFVAFLASKGSVQIILWLFMGFGSVACAFSLLPIFIKRTAGKPIQGAFAAQLVAGYALSVAAYLAGIYIFVLTLAGAHTPPPPPKPTEHTFGCTEIGLDRNGHPLFRCDEKRDG
jgi:hypothetical protein